VIVTVIQTRTNLSLQPTIRQPAWKNTAMTSIASLNFDLLTDTLDDELVSILPALASEPDVFGFAIFVPEDAGAAVLMYSIGRESRISAKPGTITEADQRYSPIEWMEDSPASFGASDELLGSIAEEFEKITENMSEEEADKAHDTFIECCARSALVAMQRRLAADSYGSIWYRVLMMTDDEHPVLKQAFESLNTGRALTEAKFMFDGDN